MPQEKFNLNDSLSSLCVFYRPILDFYFLSVTDPYLIFTLCLLQTHTWFLLCVCYRPILDLNCLGTLRVSDWLLFNANSLISQLCHGEEVNFQWDDDNVCFVGYLFVFPETQHFPPDFWRKMSTLLDIYLYFQKHSTSLLIFGKKMSSLLDFYLYFRKHSTSLLNFGEKNHYYVW